MVEGLALVDALARKRQPPRLHAYPAIDAVAHPSVLNE